MAQPSRTNTLEARLAADPSSVVFAALAEEYRRAGRLDDAIRICRAGLERHPTYLSARVTLGRALLDQGHLDESRQELEAVVRVAPDNLAAVRGLAEIHRRRGEGAEALGQMGRGLALVSQGGDRTAPAGGPERPVDQGAIAPAPSIEEPPPLEVPVSGSAPVVASPQEHLVAEVEAVTGPEPDAPAPGPEGPNGDDLVARQRRALEHFLAEIVKERDRRTSLAG